MKEKILFALKSIIEDRVLAAKTAMEAAQESANGEGKSSAGDKYETSRAMGQIDRDMFARQLVNAQNEKAILEKINLSAVFKTVSLGSLVSTSSGIFFMAISLGKVEVNNQFFLAISSNSPIGAILMGKKAGDTFLFMGKKCTIISIE